MIETLKKLAGKALPWCFWTAIVCAGLTALISIFLWIEIQYHLGNYKTEGFYAKTMANSFMSECDGFVWLPLTVGFWAGVFALGCGFLTRQFKRPIVALSVVVGSAILLVVAEGSLWWTASSYDNALISKLGYTEAKSIEKDLCIITQLATIDRASREMSISMYSQVERSVSEVRNYNRETVKMICAGADASTIENRLQNAGQQANYIYERVKNNHQGGTGNGGYNGGY